MMQTLDTGHEDMIVSFVTFQSTFQPNVYIDSATVNHIQMDLEFLKFEWVQEDSDNIGKKATYRYAEPLLLMIYIVGLYMQYLHTA